MLNTLDQIYLYHINGTLQMPNSIIHLSMELRKFDLRIYIVHMYIILHALLHSHFSG